ncbi:hypothetical protein ACFQY3_23750 [Paenibacillus farraposensis]|uniref:hypothetical protein n=1 Tax=Paenibacillus farraposensis TaxID=2807095 RepID=UPI003608E71C
MIPAHTAAELVFKIEETELHAISEGARKKKAMSTRIEAEHQQAARKRKVIKTQITDAEDGIRLKKQLLFESKLQGRPSVIQS